MFTVMLILHFAYCILWTIFHLPGLAAIMTPSISPLTTIAQLQSNSLPMLVQREIERMILSGDLLAGDKLNETTIAERLGVSRGPVREAFRALEESGLVRLEKNRGVFVRQITVEEADEIYAVRGALDELAGRQLALHITAEQLQELRLLISQMDDASAKQDLTTYYLLNLKFHDVLIEFTGNKKLLSIYKRLVNELNLYRRETLSQLDNLPISTQEHHNIVEKIASGDPEAAGNVMRQHVMDSMKRMHVARAATPQKLKA